MCLFFFFFFQAEDGIRGLVRSRGLGMCIRDRGGGAVGQGRPESADAKVSQCERQAGRTRGRHVR